MKRTVSVFLGMADVVFLSDQMDIVLFQKRAGKPVDIIDEGTDDANTSHIEHLVFDIFPAQGQSFAFKLFEDALGRFQPCLDIIDRIAVVEQRALVGKDLKLCFHFADRRAVIRHQGLKFLCPGLKLFQYGRIGLFYFFFMFLHLKFLFLFIMLIRS